MASGPEEFLVSLLVILFVTIAVVLVGDYVLKNKIRFRSRRDRSKTKKKGPEEVAAPAKPVEVPGAALGSARVTRDYFNSGRRGPQTEQEKDFGTLYSEVNEALNDDPHGEKTLRLFKRIDEQYIRMLSFFFEGQDRGSSLHMEHNYLWLKYRQKEDEDPNSAFMVLMQSLGKLLERQGAQPYALRDFAQMMDRYEGRMEPLHQARGFNINTATVGFFSFSARLNLMLKEHPDPVAQEAVGKVMVEYIRFMLERHYLRMVQSHFLMELKVEHIQSITDQVEGLRRVQDSTGLPDPEVHMICHYLVSRLRMAQLRIMATLEPSPGRAQDMHDAHMRKLANDAAASGEESILWASKLGEQKRRSMVVQSEIVSLLATHFQATYAKRNVLDSWNTMESVKRKVLQEVLDNGVPVAEEVLTSCDEEWRVLNSSTKEWFSRQARRTAAKAEGTSLPGANDDGMWRLRYLSYVQEQGVGAETVVKVLQEFKKVSPPRRGWPSDHKTLLKALTGRGELRRLEMDVRGYIGLMVGRHTGLLIKENNDRVEASSVTMAIETCQKAGARDVVLCINFSRELATAEAVRRLIAMTEKRGAGLVLSSVDSEYLVSALVGCLRENGISETFEIAPNLAM